MNEEDLKIFINDLQQCSLSQKKVGAQKVVKLASFAFTQKNYMAALKYTTAAKSLQIPLEGIDLIRALAFLQLGSLADAVEALKEELRWFPRNKEAQDVLQIVLTQVETPEITLDDAEFHALYPRISPYTMVGILRLQDLFVHAKDVCLNGPAGNFVECGVAGGGTSALLAWVLHKHDTTGRKLFACDSYSGMPPSGENDVHKGMQAEASFWGTGTCSAPESSVLSICAQLGVKDRLQIVKGFFCDSLPAWKEQMGDIAFLHMDGDWYSSTRDILVNLYDNLVPGAYVQIDDYGHWDGCRKAVQEFEEERGVKFVLNECDITGVWFIKP